MAGAPADPQVLHRLALGLRQQGRNAEAVQALSKAAALAPGDAVLHGNFGNALRDAGDAVGARAAYERAIALQPAFADARNNLAVLLLRQRRPAEAVPWLQAAVALKPGYADAWCNLGFALRDSGRLQEATRAAEHAVQLQPEQPLAHYNLGQLAICAGRLEEAAGHFAEAERRSPDTDAGIAAAVHLAIVQFLRGRPGESRAVLLRTAAAVTATGRGDAPSRIYLAYLQQLLDAREASPAPPGSLPTLWVVGESHALSVHGQVLDLGRGPLLAQASWIEGCKQWHLVQPQENRFKAQLRGALAHLPAGADVLLAIGEIDCRPDEGLLSAWRQQAHLTLDEMVGRTADGFLDFVAAAAGSRELRVTVAGVPAPRADLPMLAVQDAPTLARLVARMNGALRAGALPRGWTFLDLHAISARADGLSNLEWHADHHHLRGAAWAAAPLHRPGAG